MSLLGFGQPVTGVFQMCYLVEDIEASMQRWVEQLAVGPWFLLEHFTGERRWRSSSRDRGGCRGACLTVADHAPLKNAATTPSWWRKSARRHPPATAGKIWTSCPSATGVSSPSPKRMSSPST
jgi:hypothetical protein